MVELMITMVIFVLVIAAASNIFSSLLNQFKQQTKIAETNIEGVIGLQILRADIEQAGYGLPFDLDGISYTEAVGDAADYNDATSNPPRAIVADNNNGFNGSDILVVKATNVATNSDSQNWAYISNTGENNIMRRWTNSSGLVIEDENLSSGARVIVLRPMLGTSRQVLVSSAGTFYARFYSNLSNFSDDFEPFANSFETYLVYGINKDTDPRMPFNRADYYVRRPSVSEMPTRCAPGTGVLYKATVNHNGGGYSEMPLLDCAADMQIVLGLDMDENGAVETFTVPGGVPFTSPLAETTASIQATLADAALLRARLKDVRVYILAQEGQRDTFYTYPEAAVDLADQDLGVIKTFDFSDPNGDEDTSDEITNWQNYRWKIFTLVVQPVNLR